MEFGAVCGGQSKVKNADKQIRKQILLDPVVKVVPVQQQAFLRKSKVKEQLINNQDARQIRIGTTCRSPQWILVEQEAMHWPQIRQFPIVVAQNPNRRDTESESSWHRIAVAQNPNPAKSNQTGW